MYFYLTSSVEEIWANNVMATTRYFSKGGPIIADTNQWASEVVISGSFVSTDSNVDADLVTALRALSGVPASWTAPNTITARQQFDFLLSRLVSTTEYKLHYNDTIYGYAASSANIAAGHYPYIVPKEFRILGEGSKDRLEWTMRCVLGAVNLRG